MDTKEEEEKRYSPHYRKSVGPSEIDSTIHQPLNPNVKDGFLYLWARYITDLFY